MLTTRSYNNNTWRIKLIKRQKLSVLVTTSRALRHFNDDEQRVQLARSELPVPHYIFKYRLLPTTPPSPSRHYYPRLIAGTNLPTSEGWIAWLAKVDCMHITFAQGYYTIESKGTIRKYTQFVGSKTNSIAMNQPCLTLCIMHYALLCSRCHLLVQPHNWKTMLLLYTDGLPIIDSG